MLHTYLVKKILFPGTKNLGKNQFDLTCILIFHLIVLGMLLATTW